MRVTLNEVAARAGVSLASASRALNGESASAATVARVRQAAEELSYVPDARGRSLKMGSTQQLAFAVADVGNPVYVEMMRAVEDTVSKAGYRVLISSTRSSVDTEIDLLESLKRGFADGLIISPLRIRTDFLKALSGLTIPVVVIGNLPAEVAVDNVQANSSSGIGLAVQHLVDTGRRRIGFVNGPEDTTPGAIRGKGFTAAMRKAGMPQRKDDREVAADFTFAAGLNAARTLLARKDDLDAVIAANDLIAAAVLHAAQEIDLDVPRSLAIVGMDDSALASQLHPTLTSVSLGSAERGRTAAELLLARIQDPKREPQRVIVQPELIVRASTEPATAAKSEGSSE